MYVTKTDSHSGYCSSHFFFLSLQVLQPVFVLLEKALFLLRRTSLVGCCGCSEECWVGGDTGSTSAGLVTAAVAGSRDRIMADKPSWAFCWSASARHTSEEPGVEAFNPERIISDATVGFSDSIGSTSLSDPSVHAVCTEPSISLTVVRQEELVSVLSWGSYCCRLASTMEIKRAEVVQKLLQPGSMQRLIGVWKENGW